MNYQHQPMDEVLHLWIALNRQIAHIVTNIPEDKLVLTCDVGDEQTVTLAWLIEDYVGHLEHHLKQIWN